nr:dihydroorotate dehydrogenase [Anaerostipes faecalis]
MYYKDKNGSREFVTKADSDKEIFQAIEEYSMEHGFGLIYMIHHIEKDKIYYDIGKDGCFFVVEVEV